MNYSVVVRYPTREIAVISCDCCPIVVTCDVCSTIVPTQFVPTLNNRRLLLCQYCPFAWLTSWKETV